MMIWNKSNFGENIACKLLKNMLMLAMANRFVKA